MGRGGCVPRRHPPAPTPTLSKPWSIVKLLFKKKILRREDAGRPAFRFGKNGTPEEVDWLGAKNQIDAAVASGVEHFIFVSSMGGVSQGGGGNRNQN